MPILPPAIWPALTVEVLAGADRTYGTDWASGRHIIRDDFSRLYRVRQGCAVVWTGGRSHRLQPGALHLIPAGTAAAFSTAGTLRLAWLHLRLELAPGVGLWHRHPGVHALPLVGRGRALDRALAAIGGADPAPILRAAGGLLDLLAGFAPDTWRTTLPGSAALEPLLPVLRALQREPERPWSLAQLAALAHLHPTYLSNRFAELLGAPPLRFLHRLRLRRARRLLLTTALPVATIARHCGYADPLYFSRRFRSDAGVPPTRYRELRARFEG